MRTSMRLLGGRVRSGRLGRLFAITLALRFAPEHVVRVRDHAGTTEERFPASPAYALEIHAFEGELRGERSLLPDGEDSVRTVAVTQAVLQAIAERCSVAVSALVPAF